MPPKSARGRRAKSASTRKSTPKKSTVPPDPADETPAALNDVALEAESEKTIANSLASEKPSVSADTRLESPTPENPKPAVEAEETTKDAALDGRVEEPVAAPQNDVVLGSSSETLVKEEGDSEKDNAVEDGGKEAAVGADDSKSNNGGKPKKVVKKTVKVVKKVIKKVPKKVSKGEVDATVENLAEVPKPSSAISGGAEAEDAKGGSNDVELSAENCSTDVSVPVKIEEVKIDEKKDLVEGEGGKVEEGSGAMEIDDNVKERGGECRNEDEHLGAGKDDAEGKEEELEGREDMGRIVKEEEMGEGKFFSGELEAMERRKRRRTEIFIGGLDKDAKEEDIKKVFAEAGEIVDLRVVMNAKTGKNKGFAFLRYASADDAKRALEKFAKVEICGKQCGATPVEGNDTIFLGNIDKKWKDEDVVKLLLEIGIEKIDKVTVMIDPNKGDYNRGFAFVEFETSKDAQIAFKKLQKKDVFGKNLNIKVAWAEPLKELDEEEMLKVKTVYAEFIPASWDEEKVRDTFKKFGEIDDIVLARNLKTTKRKDFAFISYKSREAAIECIESFSREMKDEEETKVNVKVSLAKPMQKTKKQKPAAKPFAKEVPKKKQKTSHNHSRSSEQISRAQPALSRYDIQIGDRSSRYDIQIGDRSSTNAELAQLLREQASWRPSHTGLSGVAGPPDVHYSSSLHGGRHQLSMLEADPLRPDMSRYPYPRLDASFPVASSSRNVMPLAPSPSGLTSSLGYHQQHSIYPSGALYGARSYPGNAEIRGKAHGSNFPYHRY